MREDSIQQFRSANREDLAEKEAQELEILKNYLPEDLTDEELDKIIQETIKELNASSKKRFWKSYQRSNTKSTRKSRQQKKLVN